MLDLNIVKSPKGGGTSPVQDLMASESKIRPPKRGSVEMWVKYVDEEEKPA